MPIVEKEIVVKGRGRAIVSDKVRSHANDPFFVKKNAEAKDALSKTDLSILKKK
ncbi:MAG: hypothetical protein JWL97_4101 [Gemmatimonadales bacterium]|nr:hypothetical protein [Gemmatimonadales bacterium]